MKKCPFCAEEIQNEAIKCKHCGESIAQVASTPDWKETKVSPGRFLLALCIVGLIIVGVTAVVMRSSPKPSIGGAYADGYEAGNGIAKSQFEAHGQAGINEMLRKDVPEHYRDVGGEYARGYEAGVRAAGR